MRGEFNLEKIQLEIFFRTMHTVIVLFSFALLAIASRPVERKGHPSSYMTKKLTTTHVDDTIYDLNALFDAATTLPTESSSGDSKDLLYEYGPKEIAFHASSSVRNLTITTVTIISPNATIYNYTLEDLRDGCADPDSEDFDDAVPFLCLEFASTHSHGVDDPMNFILTNPHQDVYDVAADLFPDSGAYNGSTHVGDWSSVVRERTPIVIFPPGVVFDSAFLVDDNTYVNFDTDGSNYHVPVIQFGHNYWEAGINLRYADGYAYIPMEIRVPMEAPYIDVYQFIVMNMHLDADTASEQSFRPANGTRCSWRVFEFTDEDDNEYSGIHAMCSLRGWNANHAITSYIGDYVISETLVADQSIRLTTVMMNVQFQSWTYRDIYAVQGLDFIMTAGTNLTAKAKNGRIRRDAPTVGYSNTHIIPYIESADHVVDFNLQGFEYPFTVVVNNDSNSISAVKTNIPDESQFGILFGKPLHPDNIIVCDDGGGVVSYLGDTGIGYIVFSDVVMIRVSDDTEYSVLSVKKDPFGKPFVSWGAPQESGNGTYSECPKLGTTDSTFFDHVYNFVGSLTTSPGLTAYMGQLGFDQYYFSVYEYSHNPCNGAFVRKYIFEDSSGGSWTMIALVIIAVLAIVLVGGAVIFAVRKFVFNRASFTRKTYN